MATLWNLLLVVSLLVLSASQRCSGVNHDSVNGLSEEIARLKTQLQNKDEMVKAVREETENIKQQLENQNERVRHLKELGAECMQLVTNHTNAEKLLSNMVQDLEKRIMDHRKKEQLDETVVQLNNTVAAQKNDTGVDRKQEIIRLVQQFNNTKDWERLRRGLETVLDHNSEAYSQLQSIEYCSTRLLWCVGYHNSVQLVSLLLDAGFPVDTADDVEGFTLLIGATIGGHLQMVKLLLDRGASVNMRNKSAWTPLMYATSRGHLEMVQLLVSAGADTTAKDSIGSTALDLANSMGRTAVFRYLRQFPH